MPHRLKQRQEKIQEKRKQTPWRDFVMEICSWSPMSYYNQNGIVTIYPENKRTGKIMSHIDFENHRDDLLEDMSEKTTFFDALQALCLHVPVPAVRQYYENQNSTYSDSVADAKNSYLSRCSIGIENVGYSLVVKRTQDVYNSIKVQKGEGQIYMSVSIDSSFNIFYSRSINNCSNVWFSSDLYGCSECLFCHGLDNQKYCIHNEKYEKDVFYLKKSEYLSQKNNFNNRFLNLEGSAFKNYMCEDIENIYGGTSIKNGSNGFIVGNLRGVQNMYDVALSGSDDDFYAVVDSGGHSSQIYCCSAVASTQMTFYSIFLESCSYCLGCIGLKNKSFCIYNKQYSKDERYDKADEIFTQMERDGILGDFFPGSMNPFYFNDTVAYLIDDSFTKEEVEAKGYLWRDEKIAVDIPTEMDVVRTSELDQYEGREGEDRVINPEILKKVIQDEEGNIYRVVKMEVDFLMKHSLPLPRVHRLERLKQNFTIA